MSANVTLVTTLPGTKRRGTGWEKPFSAKIVVQRRWLSTSAPRVEGLDRQRPDTLCVTRDEDELVGDRGSS